MEDTSAIEISKKIDSERLSDLMDSGRGKRKDRLQIKAAERNSDVTSTPDKIWNKMKDGTKWKNTELSVVTGITRKTIGELRNGKYYENVKQGSTNDLISKIADALDVDPEYLTGEQAKKKKRKQTQEELESIQKNHEILNHSRRLRILANFMKLYSIHVKYDNTVNPQHYWLWDADGELIRDGNNISDLDPLVDIVMNYLKTGSDILNLFFGDMWIDEL